MDLLDSDDFDQYLGDGSDMMEVDLLVKDVVVSGHRGREKIYSEICEG